MNGSPENVEFVFKKIYHIAYFASDLYFAPFEYLRILKLNLRIE